MRGEDPEREPSPTPLRERSTPKQLSLTCSPARTIPAAEAPAAAARVVACAPRRAGPATRARKPAPLDTTAPLLKRRGLAAAALTLVLPTAWPDDMVMAMADAMRAYLTPGVFVPSGIRYTRTGVT